MYGSRTLSALAALGAHSPPQTLSALAALAALGAHSPGIPNGFLMMPGFGSAEPALTPPFLAWQCVLVYRYSRLAVSAGVQV
jgi:hypothetical protein